MRRKVEYGASHSILRTYPAFEQNAKYIPETNKKVQGAIETTRGDTITIILGTLFASLDNLNHQATNLILKLDSAFEGSRSLVKDCCFKYGANG